MAGYLGASPVPQTIQKKQSFTATASQTTFTTTGYTDGAFINVYLNGVRLINGTDYTATNGSDIVLTTGASASDVLDFETFNEFTLVDQTLETPTFRTSATLKNDTHEDTDGGRESTLIFKGEQSGGEISTLAQIQASHDGTADDQKGDLIFKTNDGSDNDAPTERLRIDSAGSIIPATLGASNTHLGEGAGSSIASGGNENVLIGKDAGAALTTGDNNTAVGTEALATEDANGRNTAIGFQSLQTLNAGVDGENVAIGYRAGKAMTVGQMNTLVGTQAGDALTDAHYNTAVGRNAMSNDTKGSRAVAIGYGALVNQNFTSSTDNYNVGVGFNAGEQITTGDQCTLIGGKAGDSLTNNNQITMLGYNLATSATSGTSREIIIGSNGTGGGSNTVRFATSVGIATLNIDGSDTSWAAASDLRLKKDVEDSTVGLSFINDLRPITFKWNNKNAIADSLPQYDSESSDPVFGEGKAHHGFIAQEVKTVIDSHSDVVDGHNIWAEDPDGTQQVAPSALIPMLTKAIQELSAKVDALETENTAIKARLDALEAE